MTGEANRKTDTISVCDEGSEGKEAARDQLKGRKEEPGGKKRVGQVRDSERERDEEPRRKGEDVNEDVKGRTTWQDTRSAEEGRTGRKETGLGGREGGRGKG